MMHEEQQSIFTGTYDRRWYQDLNSTIFAWIRWSLFINQILWIIVLAASNDNTLSTVCYCLAVLPSLVFLLGENVVLYITPDDIQHDLHERRWIAFRVGFGAIAVIFMSIWLGVHQSWLLVCAWIAIAIAFIVEGSAVCQATGNCCFPPRTYTTV